MRKKGTLPNPIACLERLLQRSSKEIVENERKNDGRIHLYDTGLFWMAFGVSAHLALEVFPEEAVLEVIPSGYPFRMPATVVSYDNLSKYSRSHIISHSAPGHCVVTPPADSLSGSQA